MPLPLIAWAVRVGLADQGYEVCGWADSAPEAVRLAELHRPDVAVVDFGLADGSDGDGIRDKEVDGRRIPFEFTMLTYQTETGVMAATLMKTCLDQIGIICNVKPTEFTVLVDSQQKKRYDAAMAGWGSGTGETSSPLKSLLATHDPKKGMGGANITLAIVESSSGADAARAIKEAIVSDVAGRNSMPP